LEIEDNLIAFKIQEFIILVRGGCEDRHGRKTGEIEKDAFGG
jgi:hypothetical protein